jgi:hypothetical protein
VATLGVGIDAFVNNFIIFLVSTPETRTIAIPEVPGPVERAYIVIRTSPKINFY